MAGSAGVQCFFAMVELGFFGDTLNATSRIQGLCKVHDESCIVSGAILERSPLPNGSSARSLGVVELRGKSETMELYAITCPAGTSPESG